MKKDYTFDAKLWLYPGKAAWHFITVPTDMSKNIDYFFMHEKRGWGSLRVQATIGTSTWKTSIFPDKKIGSYLLPIKVEVRKKESLRENQIVSIKLMFES